MTVPNSLNRHELAGVTSWGFGCAVVSFSFIPLRMEVSLTHLAKRTLKTFFNSTVSCNLFAYF